MAYQAKTWVGRELIRATALNHIEEGIETNSEKIEALEESSVSYKEQQVLTEQEKLLARENIGAAGAGEAGIAQNGIAAGGASGQMLVKTSLTDYITGWTDIPHTNVINLTVLANAWQGSNITLTANGVTASNDIVVSMSENMTEAQYNAVRGAGIICTAQGTNSITLTAYDEVPSINIPITVFILP